MYTYRMFLLSTVFQVHKHFHSYSIPLDHHRRRWKSREREKQHFRFQLKNHSENINKYQQQRGSRKKVFMSAAYFK